MNIPLVNLAAQYKSIAKDVDSAIKKVCEKADFILGDEVETFEQQFAKYIGVKYCVGVASGTDAIKLMLIAAGIGKGDEVIVQANTFISSVLPIIELGAVPKFIDCDSTGAMDVNNIVITKKLKAILPVHLYGCPLSLNSNALTSKLLVLEDAAQAHGSTVNGKKAGSFGAMAAFSFYPGKNLGAYGDGGAIVTNSKKYAETIRTIRNIGQRKKYDHVMLGTNSRLDTIQAAILSVKLRHLNAWNKKRNQIALHYLSHLSNVGDVILPIKQKNEWVARAGGPPPAGVPSVGGRGGKPATGPKEYKLSNWHLFVIQTKKRNQLAKYLEKHGVHTGIHYPVPLHLTPALKFLGYKKGDFPHAEKRAQTMLSLPMYAELTQKEVKYITQTIKKFYET